MPPRRRRASGLTDEDIARLRGQLADGRRPRVALSGPQFEAGASGSVVRIGDPATDGADYLTVRVKVNGVTDELAFAPAELSTGRPAAQAPPAAKAPARPRQARSTPARATRARTAAPPDPPAAAPNAAASVVRPAAATVPAAAPSPVAPPPTVPVAGAGNRRRKAPAAPTVSVTVSSSGAAWTVSASRGARSIVKNAPIPPGVVTALAELLGQPAVTEAVAEINEAALQQARQRAEQLRAELHDLEAVLATHRAPR